MEESDRSCESPVAYPVLLARGGASCSAIRMLLDVLVGCASVLASIFYGRR